VASSFKIEIASSVTHALNIFGHPCETLWVNKLLALSVLFFYAFFNFTLCIRYDNHASLLIHNSIFSEEWIDVHCSDHDEFYRDPP
jgi:uncharacterized membrane protein